MLVALVASSSSYRKALKILNLRKSVRSKSSSAQSCCRQYSFFHEFVLVEVSGSLSTTHQGGQHEF